jgi:hypothetical protein
MKMHKRESVQEFDPQQSSIQARPAPMRRSVGVDAASDILSFQCQQQSDGLRCQLSAVGGFS